MKKIIFPLLAYLFIGCSGQTNKTTTFNTFPKIIQVEFKEIETPPILPFVGDMLIVDNTLITMDMMADTIFHVFKLPTCEYIGGFINRGNGPNEEISIAPYISGISDSSFFYRSVQNGKIAYINKVTKSIEIKEKIDLPSKLMGDLTQIMLNDNLIGYDMTKPSDLEYESFNIRSKEVHNFGSFPKIDLSVDKSKNNQMFTKIMANRKDGLRFAALYDKFPYLRIYGNKNNLIHEIRLENKQKLPSEFLENIKNPTDLEGTMINYLKLKVTDSYIYGLYVGKTRGELKVQERKNDDYGCEIHIWDWNGNPIAKLILEKEVSSFAVSSNNKYIICSSVKADNILYKIDTSI